MLLDGYIKTNRFCEFIDEFLELENDRTLWEFYLHKVYEKSFSEFKDSVNNTTRKTTDDELKTAIRNSQNMLNNFSI